MEKLSGVQKNLIELYKMEQRRVNFRTNESCTKKRKSMRTISKELNVSPRSVNIWLREQGIASRQMYWR